MKKIRYAVAATCVIISLLSSGSSLAGSILLANDEWTLSNWGFGYAGTSAENFATNIAAYFANGGTGSFLVYSENFGLTGSRLADVMTSAGHGWTVSTGVSFDLSTLSGYDAVFLAGNTADNGVLIDYVEAGGNVYLAAGTAFGVTGASGEAAKWKTFLNHFGLELDGTAYNSITGNIPISNSHPLFQGVSQLYQNNGNSVLDIDSADPRGRVLVTYDGAGLYALYESRSTPVPEPSSLLLMMTGLFLAMAWPGKRILIPLRKQV